MSDALLDILRALAERKRDTPRETSEKSERTEPPRRGAASAEKDIGRETSEKSEESCCSRLPGIVGAWVAGLARLHPDCLPADVPLNRWQQFLADARRLFDGGIVAQAASAGWTAHDLFGCDNTKPFGRVDQMGLVWFVKGGRIVSISMSAAVIETPTGVRQTFRRKDGAPGRVLVWELFNEGGRHS
jgi:hypothetical protein